MEQARILIIDDNPEIREVITILLEGEGFETDEAGDGETALEKIRKNTWDLLILDVMMPGKNGYQTCVEIRKLTNVPILFLSARSQVEDKTMGFLSGGDDYLPKPFSYQELLGRVKALVRRYQIYRGKPEENPGKEMLAAGNILLDAEAETVWKNGTELALTDTEFSILKLLLKNKKQIFSVERLYETVWEEAYYYGASNIVMVHIRNLRTKIEDNPHNPQIIRTVWGRGIAVSRSREPVRRLTTELMVLLLISAAAAVGIVMFMYTNRFGFYAWATENRLVQDNREEYKEWMLQQAKDCRLDLEAIKKARDREACLKEAAPFLQKIRDDYIWMNIYEKETGEYVAGYLPRLMYREFWGAWMWSDASIYAQGQVAPVEFDMAFENCTVSVVLYTYGIMQIMPLYLAAGVLFAVSVILLPVLIFTHRRMKYLGKVRSEVLVMAGGDLNHALTVRGKDEITSLSRELDSLRLTLKENIEQEQRSHEANRELIRAVSHDLRTPLTALKGYLEILANGKGNPEKYPEYLSRCLQKTEEIRSMTDKTLEYALVFEGAEEVEKQSLSLEILWKELEEQTDYLKMQGFSVKEHKHPETEELRQGAFWGNAFLIHRLFGNLFSNIWHYGEKDCPVEIRIFLERNCVKLQLENKIREKKERLGSGVGLKSTEKIASLHGGAMDWKEEKGYFSVSVTLPLSQEYPLF